MGREQDKGERREKKILKRNSLIKTPFELHEGSLHGPNQVESACGCPQTSRLDRSKSHFCATTASRLQAPLPVADPCTHSHPLSLQRPQHPCFATGAVVTFWPSPSHGVKVPQRCQILRVTTAVPSAHASQERHHTRALPG